MDLSACRFAPTHEWARPEGGVVTVGISKFAVEQLTDVTYLKLPKPGTAVTAGEPFGEIESVKSVNDLYAPVTGTVAEVNKAIEANPAGIGDDPYGAGWLVKITPAASGMDHLKSLADYEAQIATEGH